MVFDPPFHALPMFLANANWNLTVLLGALLSGLLALWLGTLLGNTLWGRDAKRAMLLRAENERLQRESAALERACRSLETDGQ